MFAGEKETVVQCLSRQQRTVREIANMAQTPADLRFVKLLADYFRPDEILLIMRARQKAMEG